MKFELPWSELAPFDAILFQRGEQLIVVLKASAKRVKLLTINLESGHVGVDVDRLHEFGRASYSYCERV